MNPVSRTSHASTTPAAAPEKERLDRLDRDALVLNWTRHATQRQTQRHIPDVAVGMALRYGRRSWNPGGRLRFFLGRRCLPDGLPPDVARRAEGTTVIVARDGAICTVYRDFDRQRRR